MNILGYVIGVLAHVAFKWTEWAREQQKPFRWRDYWDDHGAANIGSAIAALVFGGLWVTGILGGLISAVLAGVFGFIAGGEVAVALPVDPGTSILAGYVMDSIARHITKRLSVIGK